MTTHDGWTSFQSISTGTSFPLLCSPQTQHTCTTGSVWSGWAASLCAVNSSGDEESGSCVILRRFLQAFCTPMCLRVGAGAGDEGAAALGPSAEACLRGTPAAGAAPADERGCSSSQEESESVATTVRLLHTFAGVARSLAGTGGLLKTRSLVPAPYALSGVVTASPKAL
jgi:hypothetical protein